MSVIDAIKSRRSVRTFDGTDLRPDDAEKVEGIAGPGIAAAEDTVYIASFKCE